MLRAHDMLGGQSQSSILGTSMAIILYCIFNLIRALSEYGMGFLSDYINRKNLLALFGFGLFAVTCVLLMTASPHFAWWMLIFITAAISAATVGALEKAYSADLVPTQLRGTGYGLLEAANGIG